MGQLTTIPISQIRENPVALRAVNRAGEAFLGLVDSMKQKGFHGAITVRQQKDEKTGDEYYELIDGLHRLTAAKEAGLEEIGVDILTLDDAGVMETQVMANMHRIETKPVEYSRQLRRLIAMNPLMTEAELAVKLGKSAKWVSDRLGLNKIEDEKIAGLVNEGKINLSNAYALAKLPPEEQKDWKDRAMTQKPEVFVPAASQRIKEIKAAAKAGRDANPPSFEPTPHMQKLGDVKAELSSGKIAKTLGVKDMAGWNAAIQWVLHLDSQSVKAQKAKFEATQKEQAEKKAAREKKAKEAKEAKAQKALDDVKAENASTKG